MHYYSQNAVNRCAYTTHTIKAQKCICVRAQCFTAKKTAATKDTVPPAPGATQAASLLDRLPASAVVLLALAFAAAVLAAVAVVVLAAVAIVVLVVVAAIVASAFAVVALAAFAVVAIVVFAVVAVLIAMATFDVVAMAHLLALPHCVIFT